MKRVRAALTSLATRVREFPWRSLLPSARDAHVYPGLLLLGWGLWHSPVSWLAPVVVGFVLFYLGAIHPILAARVSNGPDRQA